MSSVHVCISICDRYNKVHVKVIDHIDYESEHHNETCVFKVGKLYVHCSKFYSPSDVRIVWGWRFESERIPISGLNILKVGYQIVIIYLTLNELSLVGWYRVSNKKSWYVVSKSIVYVAFKKKLLVLLVVLNLSSVVMAILHILMVGNVVVHRAVPGFRNELLTLRVPLFLSSAVDALLDDRPAEVEIW